MAGLERQQIAEMGWDEFADRLRTSTRDVKGSAADETSLREYFGDEEFEFLQRLAARAHERRTRAVGPPGVVILLPGIMGSNLVAIEGVKESLVWVAYLGLAAGAIEHLQLTADGLKESHSDFLVRTSTIDKKVYSRIVTMLRGRWDVQPYAFDWRKDLDRAAEGLSDLIEKKYPGKPVHLVAHSMGGLVCRNFIRKFKDVWGRLQVDGQGGRLIMLGTPNFGSFSIPQVLTGEETLLRMLSKLDLRHNLPELLSIVNTFVGSYLMLPSPAKIPEATKEIYQRGAWGTYPVSEAHLERAAKFHEGLAGESATIDPQRMIYIAGCNQKTLSGLQIQGPGRFSYETTLNGDGRVPHQLGLLEGVPTYYVEEVHGDLPRNERVIEAVDQLLERGQSVILPQQPPVTRSVVAEDGAWYRPAREYQLGGQLESISRSGIAQQLDPNTLRLAEEAVTRAAVGGETRVLPTDRPQGKAKGKNGGMSKKLTIEMAHADITKVAAPVIVVGHYKGVTPINAIGAIDKCLDGWIKYATEHSLIGGELGQLFFIPVRRKQIRAENILIAGMGQEGKFTPYDLQYLTYTVTRAVAALKIDSFATILIGGGAGNVPEDKALQFLVAGVCEALHRLPPGDSFQRLLLVERDLKRYGRLGNMLKQIAGEDTGRNTEITVKITPDTSPQSEPETLAGQSANERAKPAFGPRLTIERDGDVIRYSALTTQSVIPVRQVEIQNAFQNGISERLKSSQTRDEQEKFGQTFNNFLFPEDFQEFYDTTEPVTLILDRSTAALPWEMGCFPRRSGIAFFGPDLKLTRQFRTHLSRAPGIAPALTDRLRVLVIADPAAGRLHLEGARREGEEVIHLFADVNRVFDMNIEVVSRIGPSECDPVDILALMIEPFDIIHFAGHGVFDEKKPNHGGWVFGTDDADPTSLRLLSAREIFLTRRVPRLVFSNACFSAMVRPGAPASTDELNQSAAGLAEAFFARGVQNYIGAGWPVDDGPAVVFAKEFYAQAITGMSAADLRGAKPGKSAGGAKPQSLGNALAEARRLILGQGSTWGAYQHYGDATAVLLKVAEQPQQLGPPAKRAKRARVSRKK